MKAHDGIFPKSSRSGKDPQGGLGFFVIWCGSLVGLPVDRLGFSDILISFLLFSFLLFRTQHRGTRTPTRTRLLEPISDEHQFQST